MEPTTGRRCPKCGSGDYVFRGRKNLPAEPDQLATETKYACRACGHGWKEKATDVKL